MNQLVQATITVLAVVNPIVSAAILMEIVAGQPRRDRILAATRAALTILVILVVAGLIGRFVLQAYGISMETFRIVGGIIIATIGFQMMGGGLQGKDDSRDPKTDLSRLVMFAASPGTIATVVTLSAVHTADGLPLTALIAVVVVVLITWVTMVAMVTISRGAPSHGQQFATKFMGLIVIAMGLQFALEGYRAFMAAP